MHQSVVSGSHTHKHHHTMMDGLVVEGMMMKIKMPICCRTVSPDHHVELLIVMMLMLLMKKDK